MGRRTGFFLLAPTLFAFSGAALHAQQGEAPAAAAPQAKVYSIPTGSYSGLREGERAGRPVGVDLTLGQGGTGTLTLYQGYFKNDCAGRYTVTSAELKGETLAITAVGGVGGCPGTLLLQVVDGGRKLVGTLDASRVELSRR